MAYPVLYLWETSAVEKLCDQIKPAMSRLALSEIMHDSNLNYQAPVLDSVDGARWTAKIRARTSWRGYHCEIRGSANKVATTKIIRQASP